MRRAAASGGFAVHPLLWLAWRDSRNAAVGLLSRLRQPRGALALGGLLLFAALVGYATRGAPGLGGNLYVYGPMGLTLLVVLGAFSPLGLYFRPADVDWLMTAPVSRTALVLYNVSVRARAAVFSGLLLSLLPAWRGTSWWASFTGYTLVFLLLQTSAQWLAVLRAWLALRVRPWLQRGLFGSLIAFPILAVVAELARRPELSFRDFFLESRILALVGAPAQPFLGTIGAAGAWEWWSNAAVASAILAIGVAHICWLDVPYREAAVQQSERRRLRLSRMRSGGGAFSGELSGSHRRVPMFPRLGGAGPVAWRQVQELLRNPRGMLLVLAIVGLATLAALGIPWLRGGDPALAATLARSGIALVIFLPLLMGDNLACDFRRDLDRMALLKSWPIAPLALAAGQIAPAAAFATAIQWVGLGCLLAVSAALPLWAALVLWALLPAVSWISLCIDNLIFLWMPYRTVPDDPGDVGFVGRTLGTAMLKFASLAVVLGALLALGQLAQAWLRSPIAAVGVPLVGLIAACVLGTLAVADAFRRYDVARHSPV